MPSPLPPCHRQDCKEPGMYAENDFNTPKNDRPVVYSCFKHRPGTEVKEAAEPKFNQPGLL